jgi:hypothetical protein
MSKDNKQAPNKPSKGHADGEARGERNNPANKKEIFNDQKTTTSTGPKSPTNKK